MKKSNYFLIGFMALCLFSMNPMVYGQSSYTFAGSPGNVKILKVTTVDETGLVAIFGSGWSDTLELAFGTGCNVTGARSKSVVTIVNKTQYYNFGLGLMEMCNITVDYWLWTTAAFTTNPDFDELSLYFLKEPKNLTDIVNLYTLTYLGFEYNVTVPFSMGFLGQLPIQGATFLSELDWEDDWSSNGFKITHEGSNGYIIYQWYAFIPGFVPIGMMYEDCTEIWTYDSTYGAFIGYKLLNSESSVVYEFTIELETQIPGFELTVLLSITAVTIVCLVYVLMKKKR